MVLMPRAKLGKKSRRRSGSSATSKSTVRRAVAGTATISKSVARRPPQSLVLTVGKTSQALPVFHGTLSVIISARNEEETLQRLLKQVARLKPTEIIVVLNGCRDSSFERARLSRQAIVVHCPDSAGHDVGRAIGAKLSRGIFCCFWMGIWLFLLHNWPHSQPL
ncbi:glycosyltransferase [Paenibacillus sp. 19GGS1-52]|uniref:glycosyltransferase family 2 protein n=1 Tax=Paenibacillus sp. 19GGS1-52 TaxID=2758563 RepID=UPI001EFA94D3|nr:glycosyltransferase [Paenibacillus sp. 19GGS1-52]